MKTEMTLGRMTAGIAIVAVVLLAGFYGLSRLSAPDKSKKPSKTGTPGITPRSDRQRNTTGSAGRSAAPKPRSNVSGSRSATTTRHSPTPASRADTADGAPPSDRTPSSPLEVRIQEIAELATFAERDANLAQLANEIASEDFRGALEMVKTLEDARIRNRLLEGIFHYQGANNPDEALAAAGEMKPERVGRHRTREFYDQDKIYRSVLTAAMRGWASARPMQALEHQAQLPAEYRAQALGSIYRGWAETNPSDALAHAEDESVECRNLALGDISKAWVRSDPAAAANYIGGLDDIHSGGQTMLLNDLLARWSETDIKGALDWANSSITDDVQFESSVLEVARTLSRRAPEQAAQLVGMVPELAGMQAGLTHRIADEWSKTHPGHAAEWCGTLENESLRATAIKLVASNWASKSADDALTWASDLPDENERAYALSNIAVRQAQAKTEGATQWIRQLPAGFVRARATAGYALGALRAANDFRNASLVQQQIGNQEVDVGRVREIVEAAAIPDEEREAVLALLR